MDTRAPFLAGFRVPKSVTVGSVSLELDTTVSERVDAAALGAVDVKVKSATDAARRDAIFFIRFQQFLIRHRDDLLSPL